jgi:hypothetical protein
MNENLLKLAKRRERLVADAEAQRLSLKENVDVWNKPLALADQAIYAFRYVRNHPLMVAGGGTALLSLLRPSSFGKWFRLGWVASVALKKYSKKSKS